MKAKMAEHVLDKTDARLQHQEFLDLSKDPDPGPPEVEDAKTRLVGVKK